MRFLKALFVWTFMLALLAAAGADRRRVLPYRPSVSSSCQWLHSGASVLAVIMPLAAAAGTPMPGWQLSPQRYSPGSGVEAPGKVALRAEMAGP